jgi:rRNA maturation RNase YbeY
MSAVSFSNKVVRYPQKRSAGKSPAPSNTSVHNCTRTHWDTRLFARISSAILGPGYSLSVVLIGDTRAKTLNQTYRSKPTPANVLSFPLDTNAGEIFINLARVSREASKFGLSAKGHAHFLLIHGCLHLAGHLHGSRMEEAETHFLKMFAIQ